MPAPFQRIKAGQLTWLVREPNAQLFPILENPEAFLRDRSRFIKSSRVVTIARLAPGLILRRLNYGKPIHRLRDFLRPSRAVRALVASTWLEQAGVPTPRALAAAEVRFLRWPKAAYLVTEEIPNARTLASLFSARQKLPPGIARRTADLIALLHDQRLSHRDLKWTNIVFDDTLSPWLIDLDGARARWHVSEARARADLLSLARCFSPFPQALKWTGGRFLHRYCAQRKPVLSFKPWAAALLQGL